MWSKSDSFLLKPMKLAKQYGGQTETLRNQSFEWIVGTEYALCNFSDGVRWGGLKIARSDSGVNHVKLDNFLRDAR